MQLRPQLFVLMLTESNSDENELQKASSVRFLEKAMFVKFFHCVRRGEPYVCDIVAHQPRPAAPLVVRLITDELRLIAPRKTSEASDDLPASGSSISVSLNRRTYVQ